MPLAPALRFRDWPALALAGTLLLAAATSAALAQTRSVAAAEGIAWSSLTASQKKELQPLERDWDSIDATRKTKWVEIANKLPTMPPEERSRVQTRMADWARLTPPERGQARMNFKEAQELSPKERSARWEAYKALPPDQRQQLAERAAPAARRSNGAEEPAKSAKSNVVPNSSYAPRPKPVAPTIAQAQPGATTNLINKRPSPPAHQQTGLPKIAASPGFVDQATLLPKRGPQGAATRSAAASAPAISHP